jgi:trans-aconitate methyltransferase
MRTDGDRSFDPAAFDEFEASYDAELQRGLALSGESKEFFADARIRWVERFLASRGLPSRRVLDFGCGTGYATATAKRLLNAKEAIGVDLSVGLLSEARRRWSSSGICFNHVRELNPEPAFDVAFCNGVFHHIPVTDRPAAVSYVYTRLRPRGVFAFWENNPWNPGTRLVMSKIAFDRDAQLLSARNSRHLLSAAGFRVLDTAFLFYFPHVLAALRPLERFMESLPLGAQYCVMATRD